jgi:hypothetical protein
VKSVTNYFWLAAPMRIGHSLSYLVYEENNMLKLGKSVMVALVLVASLVSAQAATAADWDISRSHRAAIKELLKEMGVYEIISASVEKGLIKVAKDDAKKAENMRKLVSTLDEEKLDATLIPLYAFYYSKKDARDITEFFRSESGRIAMKSAKKKAGGDKNAKLKLTAEQEIEVRKFFNSDAGRAFTKNRKFINQELKYRIGIMTTRLMYEYIYPR